MARDDYIVVIFISLLHLITATSVYYVTPDDDPSHVNNHCPINHECHTLQYYLLNNSKYFTSNTRLHFLQGSFYIDDDIVIDSLYNFSLVGSGINNTVLECSTPSLIIIINCTNTVIKNITTGSQCGSSMQPYFDIVSFIRIRNLNPLDYRISIKSFTTVCIFNSYSTMLQSVLVGTHGMFIINGLGNTTLMNIILYGSNIEIIYVDDVLRAMEKHSIHVFQIANFEYLDDKPQRENIIIPKKSSSITVEFWQDNYHTQVFIKDSVFKHLKRLELIAIMFWTVGMSEKLVRIKGCQFLNNNGKSQNSGGMITVVFLSYGLGVIFDNTDIKDVITNNVHILDNCFVNNVAHQEPANLMLLYALSSSYETNYFTISNCTFVKNRNFAVLKTQNTYTWMDVLLPSLLKELWIQNFFFIHSYVANITVSNSVFIQTNSGEDTGAISCRNAILNLNGPLVFMYFKSKSDSIISVEGGRITIHGDVKFFNNNAVSLLSQLGEDVIQFKENLLLNISDSYFHEEIFSISYATDHEWSSHTILQESYPMCFIQYVSNRENLDHRFATGEPINFSVIIHNTKARSLTNVRTTHCRWQSNSSFNTTSPLLVNQRFISDFDKWNDILNVQTEKSLCSCSDGDIVNCSVDILGPIYPGQNAEFSLVLMETTKPQNTTDTNASTTRVSIETINYSPLQCSISTVPTQQTISSHKCSNVSYTLLSYSNKICELLLRQEFNKNFGIIAHYSIFTVKLLSCPVGFVFLQMRCQCDPILTLNEHITDCDINDQTVLRSPNSWIFYSEASHAYRLSKNCPFDYCYSQSTKLQLHNPDLQCQFSRSGILCGQCQQDLSTIFGSSDCQQCSNMYLLLIIPIAVSGILLVMIMLILNLTVSEGTINPFILYVNILNIHNIVLFPSHSLVKPLHVFISFTNLNLGIETCFYNGMDNYSKTWLQFCFPVYLIVIITSIIIASHYSIVIQRLTLHKAVPVLATILLLSYTKILQTLSNVLFLYSTITDYPSNTSSVMWSIDANVPLFGLHHSILFVFSILIFSLLILYTCLLVRGRFLRNFKAKANIYFNPLLDAYNKAYKKNCCYWIGYELIIRCVLLATLLAVNNSTISLIAGNSFLSMVQFNYQHPYQNRVNNFSQLLLNLNLLTLYSTSLMLTDHHNIQVVVVNTMVWCAVVQFVLIILINRFSCNVNIIKYLQQKLVSKKQSDDIDVLLRREDTQSL